MIKTKISETKNQHYVPRFYQRNFSVDRKNIGAYIVDRGIIIDMAPIKHQSSEDYFYSENMEIEEALGYMEKMTSIVIDKVLSNPKGKLSSEDGDMLYIFTMIQIGRTRAQLNLMQEFYEKMTKLYQKKRLKAKHNNSEEIKLQIDKIEENDDVKMEMKHIGGLESLTMQIKLLNICTDLKYKILINKTTIPYITSDNPAAIYDSFMERVGGYPYGYGSQGLQIYMPLSDSVAIMYYDSKCYKLGDMKKGYVEINQKKDVEELNKLVACTSNKVIYFKHGTIPQLYIEKLVALAVEYKPERRVDTFERFKFGNSAYFGSKNVPIYCDLKLSFVKELPNYKAMTKQNFDFYKNWSREIVRHKDYIMKYYFAE